MQFEVRFISFTISDSLHEGEIQTSTYEHDEVMHTETPAQAYSNV